LSVKTVQNYVSSILTKLQVADRAQAIVRARGGAWKKRNDYFLSDLGGFALVASVTPSGKSPSHDAYSFGALTVNNFNGGLSPSFFISGVPE